MAKKSTKKVKPAKKATKPRSAPSSKLARSTAAGSNTMDPEKRALFLKDKEDYSKAKERLNKAQQAVRALGKTIKSDGFTMRQIKLAIQLETPEGEAEFKALVANDLLAAQYQGADVGAQLSLFLEPSRTPAVDMAADEGQKDAIEHKPAKPGYAPSTPQYKSYMEAYHTEQERQIKEGIKSDVKPNPGRTDEMAAKRAAAVTDAPAGNA